MPECCANPHKPVWYGAASCRGRCARSAIGRSSSEPCLLSSHWFPRRPSPRTRPLRDHAASSPGRTPTSPPARAASCSSSTRSTRGSRASARDSSTLRIRTAEVKGELAAARQRLRVARHTLKVSERSLASRLAAPLRAGRLRPAGGRARRLLDRRRARQPRLARPDRRPGPPRDRADAAREARRHRPHARARGQGAQPGRPRARRPRSRRSCSSSPARSAPRTWRRWRASSG